jgi:hypothetical protein
VLEKTDEASTGFLIRLLGTGHFDVLPEKIGCQEAINPSLGLSPAGERYLRHEKHGRFAH